MAKNITHNTGGNLLTGVNFKNNVAVATDTFKLIEVSFAENIKNLPKLENFTNINKDISITIKKEDINAIKIPNTKIKNHNLIQIGNFDKNGNKISLGACDLGNQNIVNTVGMPGEFPEYKKFFGATNNFEVGINVNYMMDILKTYKAFGCNNIKMCFNPDYNKTPINIINYDKIKDENIKEIKSLLMPLKI